MKYSITIKSIHADNSPEFEGMTVNKQYISTFNFPNFQKLYSFVNQSYKKAKEDKFTIECHTKLNI